MSIFGTPPPKINIFGIHDSIQCSPTAPNPSRESFLLYLYDILDIIEKSIIEHLIPKGEFGITPESGFRAVTVRAKYAQILARRIYYKNGYPVLPNGKLDGKILRQLYIEHPILRKFSFEENEPDFC